MNIFKTNLLLPASFALCLLACALSGCSGPETTSQPVTPPPKCKAGEKLENGACVAVSCANDPTVCEEGTVCNQEGKCEIVKSCDQPSDCRSRICQKGACVNPPSCIALSQCEIGYVCNSNSHKCVQSACPSGCVGEGECNEQSGQCVSKQECHGDGDCAGAEKCIGAEGSNPGECMSHDEFAARGCNGRGVVDDVEFACKDKETCSGNGDCLPGKVCSPESVCVIDQCKEGDCSGGGVCNKVTGLCENKPGCRLNSECRSGYSCIIKDGVGECREGFDAGADDTAKKGWCQQAGMACTGKRECNVAGAANSAFTLTCAENGGKLCDSTKDCDSPTERCQFNTTDSANKCSRGEVPADGTCSYTSYDDAIGHNTPVPTGQKQLCGHDTADVDHFVIPLKTGAGEVYVTATLDTLDVGAGELKLTLLSNDGNSTVLATKTQDAGTSSVTLSLPISANNNAASVVLKVEAADARVGGLKYTLNAGFTSAVGSEQSCSAVRELPIGEALEGDTSKVRTTALTDCNDTAGDKQEEVWHFHLDSLSEVKVAVSPIVGSNLQPVLSVRKASCYASGAVACQESSASVTLTLDKQVLEPGDYYVVVSGKDDEHQGRYALRVDTRAVECRTGERKCDGRYVLSCKADQTWQSDTEGKDCGEGKTCLLDNNGAAVCQRAPTGTTCGFAEEIPDLKAGGSVTKTLAIKERQGEKGTFSGFLNGNCDPYAPGSVWPYQEFVYKVRVPSGYTLDVSTTDATSGSVDGVIALFDACRETKEELGGHCKNEMGGDQSNGNEHAEYTNNSGGEQDIFIYYDFNDVYDNNIKWKDNDNIEMTIRLSNGSGGGSSSACTRDAFSCSGGRTIQQCLPNSSYQLEYQDVFTCSNGCRKGVLNAECNPPNGDKCDSAVPVNNATAYGTVKYYVHEAHDYTETPAGCGTIGADRVGGKEFVFVYQADEQKVQEVEVSVKHSGFTPLIWISDQPCNTAETLKVGACTTGVDKKDSSPGNDTTPQEDTFTFTAQKGKKYYIVVEPSRGDASDSLSGKGKANFQIKVNAVDKEECTPNTIVGCSDEAKVKYCNDFGVVEEYECPNSLKCDATDGASNAGCGIKGDSKRKGDTCFDAIYTDLTETSAQQSGQFTGTFDSTSDTFATTSAFNPKGELGQCLFSHNPTTVLRGKDRVYQFRIPGEHTLFATLNMSSSSGALTDSIRRHARVYFLENCFDENTCIGSRERGPTELYYKNESSDAKTVYLVLDTDDDVSLNDVSWTVAWETKANSEKECVPGKSHCLADGTVGVCTKDGKVSRVTEDHITCVGGAACLAGGCRVPQNQGKLCSDPVDLNGAKKSDGTLDYYITVNLKEDGERGGPQCGDLTGSAVYYLVDAAEGQWIDAESRTTTDRPAGVFVMKANDCSESGACLSSDSKPQQNLAPASTSYHVKESGSYIIAITTSEKNKRYEDADAVARITLRNAECNITDPARCSTESGKDKVVVYCGHSGKLLEYTCSGGAGRCEEGACASGNGDSCIEAIELKDGTTQLLQKGTITGKLLAGKSAKAEIDLEPSQINSPKAQKSGLCSFSSDQNTALRDAYYYADLEKGDQLDVTVTLHGDQKFFTYLIKDCGEAICLEDDYGLISTDGSERTRQIRYIAPEAGRYRLVIKSSSIAIDDNDLFTITWNITKKESSSTECQHAYSAACTSDSELTMCMETSGGTKGYLAEGRCTAGSICKKNLCLFEDKAILENISSCNENTPVIAASGKYLVPMDQLPVAYIEGIVKGGAEVVSPGFNNKIAYFRVSLQPYQVFKARTRLPAYGVTYKAIRFKDCNHINDTLIEGGDIASANSTSYVKLFDDYRAGDKPEEFYVALAVSEESSGPVRFFFEVIDPQCKPEEFKPKCKAGVNNVMLVCNAEGLYEEHTCSSGGTCSGADGSAVCSSHDGNTCAEAIVPEFSGDSYTSESASFAGKGNNYGKGVTCTNSTLEGNDVVYRVDLTAGQTLSAELTGANGKDGSTDLAIYLTKSCAALPNACLVGSDAVGLILESEWDDADAAKKTETLTYKAKGDESVFVIVDSYFDNLSSEYTLKLIKTGP